MAMVNAMGDMPTGEMMGMGGMGSMPPEMSMPTPDIMRGMQDGGGKKQKSGTRPNSKAFGKKWLDRIAKAKIYHDQFNREGQLYYGLYYHDPNAWRRCVTIKGYRKPLVLFSNPVARNVDMDRDRMMPKQPTYKVWPKVRYTYFETPDGQIAKRDNVSAARMYQEVANMLGAELDLRKTIKRAITDSLVTNLGVVKIGWDEIGGISHGSAHVENETGGMIGGTEHGERPNHELARPNFPWVTHVPWNRVVIDPTAGSFEQVNWIAEEIIEPRGVGGKVDQDDADAVSDIRNVAAGEDDDTAYTVRDQKISVDNKMRKHWEIHYRETDDAEESGYCYYTFDLYSDKEGSVKNHRKYPKDIGGFVYEFLQFRELSGDLLGYSQIRYYAQTAAHDSLTKQIILDYAIRALPFLVVNTANGKKAMDSLNDGTAAKVIGVNGGIPKDFAFPVAMPPINQELLAVGQMVRAASDEMSGRSLNDRLQGGVQTATEAKVIDRNSGEGLLAQQDILRVFAARIIKKAVRIYAELLPDDTQRHVVPNGRGGFLQFEKQDLYCDITVELDWQSTVRKDDAVERKLNMDLLMILANALPMMPNINLEPVLKKIVVSSGFDDPNEIFTKEDAEPTDPNVEHMLILAGEEVMPSPDEDLANNLQTHIEFAAVVSSDPQLGPLWAAHPGAMQILLNHIEATQTLLEASGKAVEGGVLPGKGSAGGSGAAKNRPSQGTPNEGDMMASMSRTGSNPGGTGPGRMAGV